VGRYERLLHHALERVAAEAGTRVTAIWRRSHPGYLTGAAPDPADRAAELSIAAFSRTAMRALLSQRPGVVIFTHPNLAQLVPLVKVLSRRSRVIVCTHGIEVWEPTSRLRRLALRLADAVITSASYNARKVVDVVGVPERLVRVIPLALEPSWPVSPTGTHAARPTLRLLSVARLAAAERYKGVDWVLRALPALLEGHPELRYDVVGGGDDLERLHELARSAGVEKHVRFRGPVGHEDLMAAYRDCDMFVLPSTGEGFGLVYLEAMAAGKPVLAAAVGGPIDIVVNDVTGKLVDTEDEVGPALLELLDDPARARAMGEAGARRLSEEFSFERYVANWAAAASGAAPKGAA
jgi:phosphatidylinositol alpha-1,6-mannosyltransferase